MISQSKIGNREELKPLIQQLYKISRVIMTSIFEVDRLFHTQKTIKSINSDGLSYRAFLKSVVSGLINQITSINNNFMKKTLIPEMVKFCTNNDGNSLANQAERILQEIDFKYKGIVNTERTSVILLKKDVEELKEMLTKEEPRAPNNSVRANIPSVSVKAHLTAPLLEPCRESELQNNIIFESLGETTHNGSVVKPAPPQKSGPNTKMTKKDSEGSIMVIKAQKGNGIDVGQFILNMEQKKNEFQKAKKPKSVQVDNNRLAQAKARSNKMSVGGTTSGRKLNFKKKPKGKQSISKKNNINNLNFHDRGRKIDFRSSKKNNSRARSISQRKAYLPSTKGYTSGSNGYTTVPMSTNRSPRVSPGFVNPISHQMNKTFSGGYTTYGQTQTGLSSRNRSPKASSGGIRRLGHNGSLSQRSRGLGVYSNQSGNGSLRGIYNNGTQAMGVIRR